MNLKERLARIENLAKEYARLAQQHEISDYLRGIGVEYKDTYKGIVYFLKMGGISVNVGFGTGFSYTTIQDHLDWTEGEAVVEFEGRLNKLISDLPDILHDMNRRRIKELQEELEVLTVAA